MATSQDAWAAALMGKLLLIPAMVLLLDDTLSSAFPEELEASPFVGAQQQWRQ